MFSIIAHTRPHESCRVLFAFEISLAPLWLFQDLRITVGKTASNGGHINERPGWMI